MAETPLLRGPPVSGIAPSILPFGALSRPFPLLIARLHKKIMPRAKKHFPFFRTKMTRHTCMMTWRIVEKQ
jgi:hypothetical protein